MSTDLKPYYDAQEAADRVARLHGREARRWRPGESPSTYTAALANDLKDIAPRFRNAHFERINDATALAASVRMLHADVEREHRAPSEVPPGVLVERTDPPDVSGRRITRFYGDPEVTWGPFKSQPRYIDLNTLSQRGRR